MHELPKTLEVSLHELRSALDQADLAVFDFETSSVKPKTALVAGIGFYFPCSRRCFYINVGHGLCDRTIPRHDQREVAYVIQRFFSNPAKHAVAHNATFDARMLFRMGVSVRCRVTCTMILTHRMDENLRSFGSSNTIHYHLDRVTYGLKELTQVYFNRKPPSLADTVGKKNTLNAPVRKVAQYCCLDVVNTYNLFELAERSLGCRLTGSGDCRNSDKGQQYAVSRLLREIDDPNNIVMAKMMWEGIQVDQKEVARQRSIYAESIQACREEIWNNLGIRWPLETPRHLVRVLRHLQLGDDLPFEPFLTAPGQPDDAQVSITRDYLVELLDQLEDSDQNLSSEPNKDQKAKKRVLAAILSMTLMKQRRSAFLDTFSSKSCYSDDRLYADRFDSTLATTRFSSSPNLQNLPGRADVSDADELWRSLLPERCVEHQTTRNIFVAKPGHLLVSMDLKAAEPRYMALLFQRALEIKNRRYREQRRIANGKRWEQYPILMEQMRRLQVGRPTEPYEVQWPTIPEDPLWRVFKHGIPCDDPYNALLIAMDREGYDRAAAEGQEDRWLKDNRWRGKKAFLAFAYGATPETLAPQLKWTMARTREAIGNIENTYVTLKPLRNLTMLEVTHFGEVHNLWGRPRRINGYFQLAQARPVTVGFYRMRPTYRSYVARIIPLGATTPAPDAAGNLVGGGGVQAFVEQAWVELDEGRKGEVVLAGTPNGAVSHISRSDPFANAPHFNRPPFRNINFNQMRWVEDEHGLRRMMPRQGRALRAAFNSLCQSTGADHLRWIMNSVDAEVCARRKFCDCKLVLTVHDSLIYEVPQAKVRAFVRAARPVAARRPAWSDLDMDVDVEVGRRFGQMKKLPMRKCACCRAPRALSSLYGRDSPALRHRAEANRPIGMPRRTESAESLRSHFCGVHDRAEHRQIVERAFNKASPPARLRRATHAAKPRPFPSLDAAVSVLVNAAPSAVTRWGCIGGQLFREH